MLHLDDAADMMAEEAADEVSWAAYEDHLVELDSALEGELYDQAQQYPANQEAAEDYDVYAFEDENWFQIELEISPFHNQTFLEIIDLETSEAILKDIDVNIVNRGRLFEYAWRADKAMGIVEITYHSSSIGHGRVEPRGATGFIKLSNAVRLRLTAVRYADVDCVNCVFATLKELLRLSAMMQQYPAICRIGSDNVRKVVLRQLMENGELTRGDAKRAVISVFFGHGIANWIRIAKYSGKIPQIMFELEKEGRELARFVNESNPHLSTSKDKTYSRLCAVKDHYEMRMLSAMVEFLRAEGFVKQRGGGEVLSLCHDGVMVLRHGDLNKKKLKEMSSYVKRKTGMRLSFVLKQ